MTLHIGEHSFVKFTYGHERMSPSDSAADLRRTEALIHEENEKVLDKRLKQYVRMIEREL